MQNEQPVTKLIHVCRQGFWFIALCGARGPAKNWHAAISPKVANCPDCIALCNSKKTPPGRFLPVRHVKLT